MQKEIGQRAHERVKTRLLLVEDHNRIARFSPGIRQQYTAASSASAAIALATHDSFGLEATTHCNTIVKQM